MRTEGWREKRADRREAKGGKERRGMLVAQEKGKKALEAKEKRRRTMGFKDKG